MTQNDPQEPQEATESPEEPQEAAVDLSAMEEAFKEALAPEPVFTHNNLMVAIEEAVASACSSAQVRYGERIQYALSLSVVPNQQGQPVPVILLVFSMPSGMLGQAIQVTNMMGNLTPSAQEVENLVQASVEQMLQARGEMLARAKASVNGIIFPDGQRPG